MKQDHSIEALCESLDVSRSGYYAWRHRRDHPGQRAQEDARIADDIARIFDQSRRTYGSPRISASQRSGGRRHGRGRIARLMRSKGLRGRQKARYRVQTTHDPWLYLAAVMDLCSRRIVGWAMGPSIDTRLVQDALAMACTHRRPPEGLVFHSDRGVQYASGDFRASLQKARLVPSMSRKGNCYDNASMEAFWSTLKHERVYRTDFLTHDEASLQIFDSIARFHNTRRLHSSIGYLSPADFEATF